MAWAVRELPERIPGLRIGTRTAAPENHLKLRAQGRTPVEAQAALDSAVAEARARLGDKVFAVGEHSLPEVTYQKLKAQGATVALAESCTGGLAAALLTEISGSSAVLKGSMVTYTEEAKAKVLGIDPALIAREGVVSEAVALEMATRVRKLLDATYGVGVTGWAGPTGGTERDPVGTFYLGFADARGARAERICLPGLDRERVRRFAAFAMLNLLRLAA
jgi:nicotinamide-nucleotide amidase